MALLVGERGRDPLRVYDPPECDANGVPLDWERCRGCAGTGCPVEQHGKVEVRRVCSNCEGHGSLKAAALAEFAREPSMARREAGRFWRKVNDIFVFDGARCQDCGHPMSGGTWEGASAWGDRQRERYLDVTITPGAMQGRYDLDKLTGTVHYSPCDEGCTHGEPGRWRFPPTERAASVWSYADLGHLMEGTYPVLNDRLDQGATVEASWRPVNVRTLGWAHDLRPEKLAVLCLRCWVTR